MAFQINIEKYTLEFSDIKLCTTDFNEIALKGKKQLIPTDLYWQQTRS